MTYTPLYPTAGPVRLGLISLATDLTIEHDIQSLMPEGARLHVSRVAYANPTTPENLRAMAPHIAASADLILPGIPLAAIGYGCTSGAVVIGDDALAASIGTVRPGVAVRTPPLSAVEGFRALGVRRISLLTAYVPETTAPMADYFRAAGFDLVKVQGLGLADDRDIAIVPDDLLLAAARDADDPQAEAMFVACTALPVLPLIDRIEAMLGKPVVTSNQALGWAMLQAAGLSGTGPGALFKTGRPTMKVPA
jgi:maleate isomerase